MLSRIRTLFGHPSALKQVIVVRKDLKLAKGKLAAQAAHAAVSAADKSPHKADWLRQGQKKSVLGAADEMELVALLEKADRIGLATSLIEDAGRTHLAPGTVTCLGIGPAPEEAIDRVTGALKLL